MAATLSVENLLAHARDPNRPSTKAFAGTIAHAHQGRIEAPDLFLGLADEQFARLTGEHFPPARHYLLAVGRDDGRRRGNRIDEFGDLVQLLMDHRTHDRDETRWLAHAIASSCMGGDHLYKDLGFPERSHISDLLKEHFAALFGKNVDNMKWKRFFYKQLCDAAEVKACRAPSCQVCDHYSECFLPEGVGALATESGP